MAFTTSISLSILFIVTTILGALWSLFLAFWLKPLRARMAFEAQGLKGLPYRFFYGNVPEMVALDDKARASPMPHLSHDIAPRIFSHYFVWSQKLGDSFFFWFGAQARVYVTEAEHCRGILSNKFGHFPKPKRSPDSKNLMGDGLAFLEGEKWAQHRRIVSPAFFVDKMKLMTPSIVECITSLLDNWAAQIDKEASGDKEIDVHKEFTNLAADIIAQTAFGSSYRKGKRVFEIQGEQQILIAKTLRSVYIPGSRWLPTSTNRLRWKLEQQVQKILRELIYSRMESEKVEGGSFYGHDLLGLMMAANKKEQEGNKTNVIMGIDEIVDECKTFFFAGHETSATLLTWATMLLGSNQEWQEKARAEVLEVCGKDAPTTAHSLNNLRILGMIINEALRLYPPIKSLMREPATDMRFDSDLVIPGGSMAILPIVVLHHDPKYWGPDVHEFKPQRFADGIAKATNNPAAYMPFGMGPRICIGQTFALLEAKLALAIMLQRFTFQLSPTYTHAPTTVVTIQPQYGMQIIFEKLAA